MSVTRNRPTNVSIWTAVIVTSNLAMGYFAVVPGFLVLFDVLQLVLIPLRLAEPDPTLDNIQGTGVLALIILALVFYFVNSALIRRARVGVVLWIVAAAGFVIPFVALIAGIAPRDVYFFL